MAPIGELELEDELELELQELEDELESRPRVRTRADPRESVAWEYQEEAAATGAWTGSPEQRAFREQVLNAHLARSKKRRGPPQPDLDRSQLASVRGTSVFMRTDAADAASRLLQTAKVDLAKARAAGHPDALRTVRITAASGYRPSGDQRRLWLDYFIGYYNRTRKARAAIAEGPHSARAVSYMLDQYKIPNRIAAPGYSNHQGGIAIDFYQVRVKGHEISNRYEGQSRWRLTWFFGWLRDNAARFGFRPYTKEAWHWEYKAPGASEFEYESGEPGRAYLGGLLHTFRTKSLREPVTVSVFSPRAARSGGPVDVLVYAHGLLSPCPPIPRKIPEGFITDEPFKLGKIVDASRRRVVLVVPFFDWKRGRNHPIGTPDNLNRLVEEARAAVGAMQGLAPPSLSNLILAGHSRAYGFLEPLASSHADPEMRRGALANLSQIWAFDTTYGCDVRAWLAWLELNPNLRVSVFFRDTWARTKAGDVVPTGTARCGRQFYSNRKRAGGRLQVVPLDPREQHCDVPVRRLPGLLTTGTASKEEAYPTDLEGNLEFEFLEGEPEFDW